MRIGFDAKRAFTNKSGLGSYSRNLISALSTRFPDSEYILYTTKTNPVLFDQHVSNQRIRIPENIFFKSFPSLWRGFALSKILERDGIDIYHGLSHEIPYQFPGRKVRSVVTIHDLIFIRFPELYRSIDRIIYERKSRYACLMADRIIAISHQTAGDIVEFFGTDETRIEVIHQGCHPAFYVPISLEEGEKLKAKYNLPADYILYVGTIEERKNLLTLVKALEQKKIDLPLVVIGRKTAYAREVLRFLELHKSVKVLFMDVVHNTDLRAFYQLAALFVYPSVYEGFGIPILEALASRVPVITSLGGCFAEVGGPATVYVDPLSHQEMAEAIARVLQQSDLREGMIKTGYQHALSFREEDMALKVMNLYQKVIQL